MSQILPDEERKKEVQHPTPPDRILNRILNNRYNFIFPCVSAEYAV